MTQAYTYQTKEYFWGETFYTDRHLSVLSDESMPTMIEDHSEDSEASYDDSYHSSSTKLFDTYHNTPPRAVSTLLTQVNRTYARENHQYPNFTPATRSTGRRPTRRKPNVLQTLESKLEDPRPINQIYSTWPLYNDSPQLACNRDQPSTRRRPNAQRSSTEPKAINHHTRPHLEICSTSTQRDNTHCNSPSPKLMIDKAMDHEVSYFEHSDDEGSDDEDYDGSLTRKAMKRLHIRSPSAGKIGDMTTGGLRRFFRSKKL